MNPLSSYIPPVQEPVQERGDDLDWTSLPQEPADLNFRPSLAGSAAAQWWILAIMLLTSFLSIPFGMVCRLFGHNLLSTVFFVIAFLIACCRGLARVRSPGDDESARLREIFGSFAFPLQLWAMIALAGQTYTLAWALAYLLILAMPLAFHAIDQFSTHTVHWFSANPTVSLATLNQWRKAWAGRFDPTPANSADPMFDEARHNVVRIYWDGWKRVAGCFGLGLVVVIYLAAHRLPLYRVGFWFFVTVVIALLVVGIASPRRPSLGQWWQLFVAWYGHGADRRYPGWVLQSPTDPLQRHLALTSAIWLLALGWSFVTDHFSWLLTCDPAIQQLVPFGTSATNAPRLDFSYFWLGGGLAVFYFAVTIIICTIAPCLFLVLLAYVATSPLFFHLHKNLSNPR